MNTTQPNNLAQMQAQQESLNAQRVERLRRENTELKNELAQLRPENERLKESLREANHQLIELHQPLLLRKNVGNVYKARMTSYIIELVQQKYGLSKELLFSKSRKQMIAKPRMVCYWLLVNCAGLKVVEVAALFDVDHSTVVHGRNLIEKMPAGEWIFVSSRQLKAKSDQHLLELEVEFGQFVNSKEEEQQDED